ncbi:MAG: hypothetical protein ACRD08_22595, partial [Acidimicrobiales bacterium]
MSPADALDRIVYLLDRALAESQKVRAFARARDVVDEIGDDEVEDGESSDTQVMDTLAVDGESGPSPDMPMDGESTGESTTGECE